MKHLLITIAAVLLVGCEPRISINKAAAFGDIDRVKLSLIHGEDVNHESKNGYTPLLHAAANGHKEIVELLLSKGANINAKTKDGESSLFFAALHGRKEISSILINHGSNVNAENSIYVEIMLGKIDSVKARLSEGTVQANYSGKWGTPILHTASSWNEKEIIELLISEGANINYQFLGTATALDWAIGHKETADLLRKNGAKTGEELKAEGK
jgi:ankyrin repeat protein